MSTEERTITEIAEEYAKKLYHYLKTEQFLTFEAHMEKPLIEGFDFNYVHRPGKQDIFNYTYINENEELVQKQRTVS